MELVCSIVDGCSTCYLDWCQSILVCAAPSCDLSGDFKHSSQINQLRKQVRQQANQTQIVDEKVEKEHFLTIIHMAGTFVLLTCLVTMFHMTAHLRNFSQPNVQRKIVAILWMPPIYGVASFVNLCFPSTHE
jgi:hypothetical protein